MVNATSSGLFLSSKSLNSCLLREIFLWRALGFENLKPIILLSCLLYKKWHLILASWVFLSAIWVPNEAATEKPIPQIPKGFNFWSLVSTQNSRSEFSRNINNIRSLQKKESGIRNEQGALLLTLLHLQCCIKLSHYPHPFSWVF